MVPRLQITAPRMQREKDRQKKNKRPQYLVKGQHFPLPRTTETDWEHMEKARQIFLPR
jgi:hypothetical protein